MSAARESMHRAARALSTADIETGAADELGGLAEFVVNREF